MTVARALKSGEIIVLEAAYRIAKERKYDRHQDVPVSRSLSLIADESGLKYTNLVEIHEKSFISKMLFTGRNSQNPSKARISEYFRLTDFGWDFCRFIDTSDVDVLNKL